MRRRCSPSASGRSGASPAPRPAASATAPSPEPEASGPQVRHLHVLQGPFDHWHGVAWTTSIVALASIFHTGRERCVQLRGLGDRPCSPFLRYADDQTMSHSRPGTTTDRCVVRTPERTHRGFCREANLMKKYQSPQSTMKPLFIVEQWIFACPSPTRLPFPVSNACIASRIRFFVGLFGQVSTASMRSMATNSTKPVPLSSTLFSCR